MTAFDFPSDVRLGLSAKLVDNRAQFQEPFFSRFALKAADAPLSLTPSLSKDYLFPTLYGDVVNATAMFLCSYEGAAALLPDDRFQPVSVGFGRSLVVLSSYRYRKVLGIDPYSEVAVAIPVVPKGLQLPILPLIFAGLSGLSFYVVSMPVTSLENQIRGQNIWGLPKVVQDIELAQEGVSYRTSVRDEAGEVYLSFRVPMNAPVAKQERSLQLVSKLGDRWLKARSSFEGQFAAQTFGLKALRGLAPDEAPYLTLGDGPAASKLRSLAISPKPLRVQFGGEVLSAFELPREVKA